jgi:hypothetical protein
METMRAECSSTRGISACEATCRNDGTYDICSYVMRVHTTEFDNHLDDAAAATTALEFTKRALDAGCFAKGRADDCIALGNMNAAPGKWQKAQLEKDIDEARRYYGKACLLKEPRGCRLARE